MVTNSWKESVYRQELERGHTDIHVSSKMCRFPLYEANFVVDLMDTKDGDGLESLLHLDKKKHRFLFQNHPDTVFVTQI